MRHTCQRCNVSLPSHPLGLDIVGQGLKQCAYPYEVSRRDGSAGGLLAFRVINGIVFMCQVMAMPSTVYLSGNDANHDV